MVIVIVILWGEHWVVSCPVVITSQREAWWGGPWSPVAGGGGWAGAGVWGPAGLRLAALSGGRRVVPHSFVGVASASPSFPLRGHGEGPCSPFPDAFPPKAWSAGRAGPLLSGPHASGGLPTGPSQRVRFPRRQGRERGHPGHLGWSAPCTADWARRPGGTPSESCSPGRVPGLSFPGEGGAHCPLPRVLGRGEQPAAPSSQLSLCTCPLAVGPGGTGPLLAEGGARLSPLPVATCSPGVTYASSRCVLTRSCVAGTERGPGNRVSSAGAGPVLTAGPGRARDWHGSR